MPSSHVSNARRVSVPSMLFFLVASVMLSLAPTTANADTLAGWDFSTLTGGANNWGPSPFDPVTMASNLTTVGLTRGPAVSSGTAGSAAAKAWGGNTWWGGTTSPDSLDNAITRGAYITFSLTAQDGYSLSFSDVGSFNVRRSSSGPSLGQLQYQLGSGTFANIGSAITWGSITTAAGNPQSAITLSGISDLQNVSAGTTVTFRIVNYNTGTAGAALGTWYLNDPTGAATVDFTINGAVTGTGGGNNLFWNGPSGWATTSAATGGNGTWNDGVGNWDSSKTANFGGTAGTVTVAAPSASAGLAFTTSGYSLSGGTLTLSGPSIDTNSISVATGATTSVGSVIAGSSGLTKSGGGSLSLSASNTFFGGVRIQSGTLAINGDAALGDTSNAIELNGGTLAPSGSIDLGSRQISGTFGSAGIGTIAMPAGATVTSSGLVNLAALTLPNAGTLTFTGPTPSMGGISATAASGTTSIVGTLNFGNVNRTLDVATGGTLVLDGSITNNATLSKQGGGTLVLTQDNSATLLRVQVGTAAAANGGTVRVNNGSALGAGQTYFNYGTIEASAPILIGASGFGGLSIGGRTATPVRLAGSSIEVTGSIGLYGAGSAGPIRLNVDNASTFSALMVAGTTSNITGLTLGGTGSLRLTGDGSGLTLPINLTESVSVTVENDGIVSGGGVVATSLLTVGAGASLGGNGTIGGLLVDAGGTLEPGMSPGTLTTTLNAAFGSGGNYNWQLTDATGSAGTSWDLLSVGGTLDIAATTADPFRVNLWTLSGTGPDVNGNAANFDPDQDYAWTLASATGGITNFSADKFSVIASATNGTGGFANTYGYGTFSVAQNGNDLQLVFTHGSAPAVITINVASGTQTQTAAGYPTLSGTLPLEKTGAGTLVVDQINTISGSTTIQGGVLQLANLQALQSSTIYPVAGGTLALAPYQVAVVGGLDPNAGGLTDVGSGLVTVSGGLSAANMVTAIVSGMGDGSWNGTTGITSSAAAADAGLGVSRSVGWLDNGDGTVTFAYAAPGDTNLDWSIDLLDIGTYLAAGKYDTGEPSSWSEGDYTYDGLVDITDVALYLGTGLFDIGPYNPPADSSSGVAAVPEPSLGLGVVAAAAATFVIRRRR